MPDGIDEYNLPAIVRKRRARGRSLSVNTPQLSVDKVHEERQKAFLKLIALRNLWNQVHERAIVPALKASLLQHISDEQDFSDLGERIELKQLVDLIVAFDSEVRHLGDVSRDHKKTTDLLEGLLDMISREIHEQGGERATDTRVRQVRRRRIRDQSHKIIRSMNAMEKKIATPGWLKRQWVALMGGQKMEINPELQERLSTMVGSSMRNTSRKFAGYANMPSDVIEAFGVLDLHAWSTQQEMRDRFKYMIKVYHPDQESGSDEMAKKIVDARKVLDLHFSTNELN